MAQAKGPTNKIWRDGTLVDWADANIHVMSHVVHYGSCVFEGIRAYATPSGGAVFRLEDHIRRLHDSAKIYRLPLRHSVDALCQAILDTIAANELSECYIRPLVIRTGATMGIWNDDIPVETFIICWESAAPYLGHDAVEKGADVCVSTWRRAAPNTFPALAKAGGNYLNAQLGKVEAKQNGYIEAIMLDSAGFVSEGTGENLFLVKKGELLTAPLSASILAGITRDSVIRIASDFGIPVREMQIPRELLYLVDEAFFCGTAVEVTPVRSIDRLPVGSGTPGPITRRIQERFLSVAKGRSPDAHGWLTPVPVAEPAASSR
jgi:branched-chain amino acid aminotransferase